VRIFDNLLYKVVSVLIAIVLWAAAQGVTDVEQSLDVPVAVEKVPENLVVVEESAHEINLRLVGSRAALRQASKLLQHYTVSLEGAKQGEARLSVNREQISLPRGARIAARSPSTLVYTLETVVTKSVPVRADLSGDLPQGYRLVRVTVEPKEISIVGAKSSVRNVREVVTDRIDLGRLRQSTVLESSVALGYPHVWRKDPESGPIRVNVEIETPVARAGKGGS
jgi:YbbR domain-containing protein